MSRGLSDAEKVLEEGKKVYFFGPGILEGDGESTIEELVEESYSKDYPLPDYGPERVYASD